MHPNAYLRTFWQNEIRHEIFVAMSFAASYQNRFENIIRPAIERIQRGGVYLQAKRVDLSKTGDSILTDIIDGIAHSEMVLADVSTLGHDSKTGLAYRNGNVLYEVGVALACRQASEVLLIRDDRDKFLFDVSTIPHMFVDFTNPATAQAALHDELVSRLNERDHILDARTKIRISSLTGAERQIIEMFSEYRPGSSFWMKKTNLAAAPAIARLLDKEIIVIVGVTEDSQAMFAWTRLGYELAKNIHQQLPKVPGTKPEESESPK